MAYPIVEKVVVDIIIKWFVFYPPFLITALKKKIYPLLIDYYPFNFTSDCDGRITILLR